MSILEILTIISSKNIVVGLAIFGALLAFIAPKVSRQDEPRTDNDSDARRTLSKALSKAGYLLTGLSIFLFILAGFISDL